MRFVAGNAIGTPNLRDLIVNPLFGQMEILDHRAAGVGVDQVIISVAGLDYAWIGDTDIGTIS